MVGSTQNEGISPLKLPWLIEVYGLAPLLDLVVEVLVERFGRRGEGPLFGITDMEGDCIGDCQS